MSWLRIDDGFWSNPKVIAAGNEAAGVYVRALAYCAAHSTDGEIPAEILTFIAGSRRKVTEKLVESGLVERTSTGFRAPDFLDFNPSRTEVEERRKADAERQRRSRSRKGSRGESRRDTTRSPSVPSRPDPSPGKRVVASRDDAPLCFLLNDLLAEDGVKAKPVTKAWADAERLLIERDGADRAEAERVLRWARRDSFWRLNVLSMPTFRKQYERLRLQSQQQGASVTPLRPAGHTVPDRSIYDAKVRQG